MTVTLTFNELTNALVNECRKLFLHSIKREKTENPIIGDTILTIFTYCFVFSKFSGVDKTKASMYQ